MREKKRQKDKKTKTKKNVCFLCCISDRTHSMNLHRRATWPVSAIIFERLLEHTWRMICHSDESFLNEIWEIVISHFFENKHKNRNQNKNKNKNKNKNGKHPSQPQQQAKTKKNEKNKNILTEQNIEATINDIENDNDKDKNNKKSEENEEILTTEDELLYLFYVLILKSHDIEIPHITTPCLSSHGGGNSPQTHGNLKTKKKTKNNNSNFDTPKKKFFFHFFAHIRNYSS